MFSAVLVENELFFLLRQHSESAAAHNRPVRFARRNSSLNARAG